MMALTKPQQRHQAEMLALRHLRTETVGLNEDNSVGTESWSPLDCPTYRSV